jgi:hypothetical protein
MSGRLSITYLTDVPTDRHPFAPAFLYKFTVFTQSPVDFIFELRIRCRLECDERKSSVWYLFYKLI